MRVETMQEAIEGAPTLIVPDGEGGVTFHLVTDEALLAAAGKLSDLNNWNDEERTGLYQALVEALDLIPAVEGTQGGT